MTDLLRYPDHKHNDMPNDVEVELCENCVMAEAGFDPWEGHERGEGEYDVCHEWYGWSFAPKYHDDDPDGYGDPMMTEFTGSQCAGCHTSLAGARYTCTAIHWSCPKDDQLSDEADNDRKERQSC